MRIFETNEWCNSINFVDKNNVLVGFDYSQGCCEDFGYKIIDADGKEVEFNDDFLEPYIFDSDFVDNIQDDTDYECGGSVHFRLTASDKPDLFLKLYNYHNGYYSHGFTMRVGDKIVQNGNL